MTRFPQARVLPTHTTRPVYAACTGVPHPEARSTPSCNLRTWVTGCTRYPNGEDTGPGTGRNSAEAPPIPAAEGRLAGSNTSVGAGSGSGLLPVGRSRTGTCPIRDNGFS